jgi:integrase
VEIVRKQGGNDPEGYLFPAAENGGGRGKFAVSGFTKAKRRLDALMLQRLKDTAGERGENPNKVKLEPWRIHDLRRTGATGMAALGFPIHVVERVLNHIAGATTGGLVAVYQRHEYLAERRAALEAWADYLKGLGT